MWPEFIFCCRSALGSHRHMCAGTMLDAVRRLWRHMFVRHRSFSYSVTCGSSARFAKLKLLFLGFVKSTNQCLFSPFVLICEQDTILNFADTSAVKRFGTTCVENRRKSKHPDSGAAKVSRCTICFRSQKMLCRELRIGFHMDERARAHVFTVNASSVIRAQNEVEFNGTAKKQTSKKENKKTSVHNEYRFCNASAKWIGREGSSNSGKLDVCLVQVACSADQLHWWLWWYLDEDDAQSSWYSNIPRELLWSRTISSKG